MRGLSTIALEPLCNASKGDASSDGDDNRKAIAEDDNISISSGLLVVGGGADAEVGHLVAVDVPGFRDVNVLLVGVLGEETTNDGGGHVTAAEEGDLCVL
ncbi:hypothetical protein HG531_000831 [Fusarium graminearum]|nr:hypothetical protein HG531_000831 [Fusarium graminearum]